MLGRVLVANADHPVGFYSLVGGVLVSVGLVFWLHIVGAMRMHWSLFADLSGHRDQGDRPFISVRTRQMHYFMF